MRAIFIMYMPGHAGHMLSRLFGLSPEAMPLIEKNALETADISTINKLNAYRFSDVKSRFETWQKFHQEYAGHKNANVLRIINAVSGHCYSCIVYPIHPCEFHHDFRKLDETEYYCVDLDLDKWGAWVEQQRATLKFNTRHHEQEYFDKYKNLHNMKLISLTKMLESEQGFQEEYLRVAHDMNITPVLDQASLLFNDWKSVRVTS